MCALSLVGLTLLIVLVGPAGADAAATTFVVNSAGDAHAGAPRSDGVCDTGGANPDCTLRAAIEEANQTAGADRIEFDLPTPTTINLIYGQLSVTAPDRLTIVGPGPSTITVTAQGRSRVLSVAASSDATISGLTLTGGLVSGANGGTGVPGDPASGGGILNLGALTMRNATVSDNRAIAGNGGQGPTAPSIPLAPPAPPATAVKPPAAGSSTAAR